MQNQSCLTNPAAPVAMCENSQSSVDDVVSLDDGSDLPLGSSANKNPTTIAFSKKAIHQRDADENLFLRFLELDPPPTETANAAPPSTTQQSTPASQRRQSSVKSNPISSPPPSQTSQNPLGRTPFTITKRLQRHPEKGYGFSIVWTHPPRVEKVESNLPADRAGILPGDFVIFVEKHNVVTMPEMDILNLIRSQGNSIVLEIFRRPTTGTNRPSNSNPLKSTTSICSQPNNPDTLISQNHSTVSKPVNSFSNNIVHNSYGGTSNYVGANNFGTSNTQINNNSAAILDNENNNSKLQLNSSINLGPRSSIACSNASISIENTKRRLHLPQVTFSKEVGHGVIV